jgi:pyrimidine operon attenuation protein / uracil phosphoribosyltransferase
MTSILMDRAAVERTLTRIAHEIAERNLPSHEFVLVGIQRGGWPIARRLGDILGKTLGISVPVGSLDVTMHRDDLDWNRIPELRATEIPFDVTGKTVVLVDDVLFHGRTIRAALDALHALGRPCRVQLAVLVDRGHRELPIRPDFVGKNIPTSLQQRVVVRFAEDGGRDEVALIEGKIP